MLLDCVLTDGFSQHKLVIYQTQRFLIRLLQITNLFSNLFLIGAYNLHAQEHSNTRENLKSIRTLFVTLEQQKNEIRIGRQLTSAAIRKRYSGGRLFGSRVDNTDVLLTLPAGWLFVSGWHEGGDGACAWRTRHLSQPPRLAKKPEQRLLFNWSIQGVHYYHGAPEYLR